MEDKTRLTSPRHDDITYQSIARAFNLPLVLHEQAFERMRRLSKPQQAGPNFNWDTPSDALTARLRMVQLPTDKTIPLEDQALFIDEELWVPVTVVNGNVYILPGVPSLFKRLLEGLKPILLPRLVDPEGKGMHRILISTPLVESSVAAYLTDLAARVEPKGVKVGSYPRWGKRRNTVTLVGADREYLESLVPEVEKNVEGRRVQREDEDDPEDVEEETTGGASTRSLIGLLREGEREKMVQAFSYFICKRERETKKAAWQDIKTRSKTQNEQQRKRKAKKRKEKRARWYEDERDRAACAFSYITVVEQVR
ncbi:uncharacterized protein ARB_03032 [Trichophyton benhamiae CBS 112371]|uniref:Uncharacterized protein n=1 Tax=Arthroderma benhamiae (strain ATCC MYA-4681 / CBS 112371) TaxID=663331 RepID=D4B3J3_ARTBC|nr:uncharacterized protein ARB_03032 [Trichophyton benhamiae CBS 112371]EFE29691.1 hypothetical protein ARB_03032 [Trichophyton benhamiae CBS 112371]